MTYNDYKGIMQGLGYAFNKEYKEQELKMFYRYFKDYTTDNLIKTVDDIITTYDKLPSLKQIIDRCDMNKNLSWFNKKVDTPEVDQEWIDLLNSFK